jgi:hypothetical protein
MNKIAKKWSRDQFDLYKALSDASLVVVTRQDAMTRMRCSAGPTIHDKRFYLPSCDKNPLKESGEIFIRFLNNTFIIVCFYFLFYFFPFPLNIYFVNVFLHA